MVSIGAYKKETSAQVNLKPQARDDLAWYDKKARAVEDALESGLGDCAVGTNCRSFTMFKYKLANCNMRQLYDSRCIAWAQSSKWVKSIIEASGVTVENDKNQIVRENVIYAFIAEELLRRFDPYTYDNRKVRATLSFIKETKEFEEFEKMMSVLSPQTGTSQGSLSEKDTQYIMKRLATPDEKKGSH